VASQSVYKIDLLDSFHALRKSLDFLKKILCNQSEQSLPGWFQSPSQLLTNGINSNREKAFIFLSQLEYLNTQAPRDILIGPGVFAASEETLQAIQQVNQCKLRLKGIVLALKNAKISLLDAELAEHFENALGKRPHALVHSFRKIGFSRLHLKQCYRLIPCLLERPEKISWTWAHTKAIKRISVHEAKELLIKLGKDVYIEKQLSKLETLSSQEPLAIVRSLAPHLRTNVVIRKGTEVIRSMIKGTTPIFYPAGENTVLPKLYPAFEKQELNKDRAIRADVKLEPLPFLRAIHAHRYLGLQTIMH
jgi:hypothetical protein